MGRWIEESGKEVSNGERLMNEKGQCSFDKTEKQGEA